MLTVPNLLTLLRLLMVPFFIAASFRGMFTMAFILFLSAAITDIFDGMIARRFNQRSRIGAILDPAADKTMIFSTYLFYTFHPIVPLRIPTWLTFTVMIRDIGIVVFAYLLYTRTKVTRFPPSWAGKISTLLQVITACAVISVNGWWPGLAPAMPWFFRAVVVMTLVSAWIYMRGGERLLKRASQASPELDLESAARNS